MGYLNPLDLGTFVLDAGMVASTFVAFLGAGLVAAAVALALPGRR